MDEKEKNMITISLILLVIGILLTAFKGRRRIIKFAGDMVGERELLGNMGFENTTFEELMKDVGWKKGDAWCVYLCKVVWYNMIAEPYKKKVLELVSGNTQQTLKNFKEDDSGLFGVSLYPRVGDIVIWQSFKYGIGEWNGHAGIVIKVNADYFVAVEGNTNLAGSRTGYIVAKKKREYNFHENNGLRVKGFITIK